MATNRSDPIDSIFREYYRDVLGDLDEEEYIEEVLDAFTESFLNEEVSPPPVEEDIGLLQSEDTSYAYRPSSTEFAGVSESWDETKNMDARILEVRPNSVRLEILVDRDERRFQDRTFSRDLLEGAVTLEEGNYVLVRRFKGEGKIKFTFDNANNYVRHKELFEDKSRFEDIHDFEFGKKL